MLWYILKLCILLPAIAALIWGSLKLMQKAQTRLSAQKSKASASIIEVISLSATQRLIVAEFHGRQILIGSTRQGLVRLAEVPVESFSHGDAL